MKKISTNKTQAKKTNLASMDKTEKLQKVLANLGHGSRRAIEELIKERKISVNGAIANLGDRIDISLQPKVRINGHVISLRQKEREVCRVLAYYKPEGEICALTDPQGRATVFSHLPKLKNARWINIGRLDINTSGLLLFTTDGELANRLMHPKYEVEREYAVRIFGAVTPAQLNQLKRGVQLEDGPASFSSIKAHGGEGLNQWYHVTLSEGRNREVRRMWESIDVKVSRLIRIRYGNVLLPKGLERGHWVELNLKAVNYLRELVHLNPEEKTFVKVGESAKRQREYVVLKELPKSAQRGQQDRNTAQTEQNKAPQKRTERSKPLDKAALREKDDRAKMHRNRRAVTFK